MFFIFQILVIFLVAIAMLAEAFPQGLYSSYMYPYGGMGMGYPGMLLG